MPCEGSYCYGCVQELVGVRRLEPHGTGRNGVMLLGDSPWTSEIAEGIPFAGASGTFLNGLLQKRHLYREDFLVHNVMGCRPPHLGWTDYPDRFPDSLLAAEQCSPYVEEAIRRHGIRAIVGLGKVALSRTTEYRGIEENHGYVCMSRYGVPIVPTFHPSHIIQGASKLTICLVLAINKALAIADGSYSPTRYSLYEDPPIVQLEAYLRGGAYEEFASLPRGVPDIADRFLMCDIETPESSNMDEENAEEDASYNIVRMGFSNCAGTACSFPFEGDYIRVAKEAIRAARTLVFWNKNYDLPRLRAAGFELHPQVTVIDAMWAWHFYQSDLPKALSFAAPFFYNGPPWKHMNVSRPAYYNAMDNAVQTSCFLGCKEELEAEGRWDRFMRQMRVEPILVRMGQAGVRVDLAERGKFMAQLKEDAAKEYEVIQGSVPPELLRMKQWVRQPKDMANVRTREYVTVDKKGEQVTKVGWERVEGFNPNATPQLLALIRKLGLKPPRKRGEDRETTEAKYLLRFAKKFPVFRSIVEYKRKGKMLSTYQWPLDGNMRAHTVYGYHPSTWRLSSRKVNLQNIPKRSVLAKQFRKMLVASPGHVLVEADWAAIEAVLVGYSAGSEAYVKLAKAGVHGWLMSHIIGEPIDWTLPFDELQKQCKAMKRRDELVYDAAKHVIHGGNFLFSPFGIWDEFQEYFKNERQVNEIYKLYFSLLPGQEVQRWQRRQIEYVHLHKHLRNHFDLVHYFYRIYKYDKRSKSHSLDPEGDAKRAVAFVPQSDAAFMQRELFLWLEEKYAWLVDKLRLPTHDSVVCECLPSEAAVVARVLYEGMTRKWDELGGLQIGVEIKVGENLREQEEIHVG